jgi:hypothetical protein
MNTATQTARTSTTTGTRIGRRGRFGVPAVAGVAYSSSWVLGLAIFTSSTDVRPSRHDLLATYTGHRVVSMVQFVLTEGIAAIALAVVVVALASAARRVGEQRLGRMVLAIGLSAVAVSLVQTALGLYFADWLVPGRHAASASRVFEAINRLDGVKMFLLAGLALAGFALMRRVPSLLPHWLTYVALGLAVAIVASGIGYLFLLNTLALAAWVSLPLLLVFVTGAGVALGRVRVELPHAREREHDR